MKLGIIGDDFTGSSDIANTVAKQGMRVVQYTGIPDHPAEPEVEAGVIALKSRSIDPKLAVEQSLAALKWLQAQGCQQFFFKYCSTFDSTREGNIGPVTDALADALNADRVIVCPAFPGTGRSVYQGHLFVNDALLNESSMGTHPLTPMSDPDIRRWLGYQSRHSVGHVPATIVFSGADAIEAALSEQSTQGHRLIVVDAVQDRDLYEIGRAARGLLLITGGSGVAIGLPKNFRAQDGESRNTPWRGQVGKCVALSGSCSTATRNQIAVHRVDNPSQKIDAADVINELTTPEAIADWLMEVDGIPLVYCSAEPEEVARVQEQFGREASAEALEFFFARLAQILVSRGVQKILTAGGETSGAVVEGLHLNTLEIGPEIDPGIPALRAGPDLVIALKSGNFGAPNYFAKAAAILAGDAVAKDTD